MLNLKSESKSKLEILSVKFQLILETEKLCGQNILEIRICTSNQPKSVNSICSAQRRNQDLNLLSQTKQVQERIVAKNFIK